MKFYDKAKITVQSGKWGDGVVSARRETGVPYWGPAWWNGGKWGSVIIRGNPSMNTLVDYHNKKKFVAPKWEPGRTKEQYGKDAQDLILSVPLWSLVRDVETGLPLWQCLDQNDEFVICRWGRWWVWNMHFKNSVNQYPQFALLGEPGEIREIEIELQLLADVALIGTPSVWKSSLINTIANVKAKVADYPFTTLIPNLGSVKYRDKTFNVLDVPGLIQGAADGKWLWNEFLRHIRKARVLCFLLDMSRYESWMDDFSILFDELLQYLKNVLVETKDYGHIENIRFSLVYENKKWILKVLADGSDWEKIIMEKAILLIFNKVDLIQDQEITDEYSKEVYEKISEYYKQRFSVQMKKEQYNPFILSSHTRQWVDAWLDALISWYVLYNEQDIHDYDNIAYDFFDLWKEQDRGVEIYESTTEDIPFLLENEYLDEQDARYAKVWTVNEPEVCRLTYMLPWGNDEAEMWFWNVLDKKRFLQKLLTAGLVKWDVLHIKSYYKGVDDRFIGY